MATHKIALRHAWRMNKEEFTPLIQDRREMTIARSAFYLGARTTLKVLNRLIALGEEDEAIKQIRRQARTIEKLQAGGRKRTKQRH
jgi:hypothetical protein